MRKVPCNFCGREQTILVNEGRDLYLNRFQNYRIVRCLNCGLIYQNPQLTADELLSHYPRDKYELYRDDIAGNKKSIKQLDFRHSMTRRCRQVELYHPTPGRLLEVGCATGGFMATMRNRGWQVVGVELNPEAANYGRQVLGLDIHSGKIEDIDFEEKSFDVVAMWDVFEHVLDPKHTLTVVRKILKPGGLFVAATPNPSSLEARVFGDAWAGWDRPRHLYIYSPEVLRRYLQDAGFEEIAIKSFSGRLSVTLLSIEYFCKRHRVDEKYWRFWVRAAYNWPLRLLTWPIYRLLEKFNQTTNMVAFAR